MKISIQIDMPVQSALTLARVKTSYEYYGVSRPTHVGATARFLGLPDTWQYVGLTTAENNFVKLTESLQWFWYSANVQRTPAMTEQQHWANFHSLTADDRYITNGYGSDTCRVYPTGKNAEAEPMRYFTLLTGNAVIELTGETRSIGGINHSAFWCIDASKDISEFTHAKHPHKWYQPTTSGRIPKPSGGWNENHEFVFSQFDDKCIVPIFMPNTNIAWMQSDLLVML